MDSADRFLKLLYMCKVQTPVGNRDWSYMITGGGVVGVTPLPLPRHLSL